MRLTSHAARRAARRGISLALIQATIDDGDASPGGRGCEIYKLGRIIVVVARSGAIITVYRLKEECRKRCKRRG